MTLVNEINKSISNVFRKAYIKRRSNTTGLYEADWFEISNYVRKWGKIVNSIDEISLNNFRHSGISLICRNDEGKFNPESYVDSFWYGYMTRFRTLLKIEGGYKDSANVEYPTATSSQGIFLLTNDSPIDATKNQIVLNFKSLVSVFKEVIATDVTGVGASLTASEIITLIRDHTDGSDNYVFQQFISSSVWDIEATTSIYNAATSTSLDGLDCWQLMNKLAEAEGFILLINRSGGIEFRGRDERTTTSQFSFLGQGFNPQNVIKLNQYVEPINKFYNYFRLKHLKADTSTSYLTAGTTTTVDPSSTAWRYGVRKYDFENLFITNTTTAQAIVDARRNQFDEIKEELKITTKFCPQLEISDKVEFSYRSYDLAGQTVWEMFSWDEADWASAEGEMFDWLDIGFKVLSKTTDLNKFTTSLVLRRL